jgi:F0F1-type ATP synthase membrane subunit a
MRLKKNKERVVKDTMKEKSHQKGLFHPFFTILFPFLFLSNLLLRLPAFACGQYGIVPRMSEVDPRKASQANTLLSQD